VKVKEVLEVREDEEEADRDYHHEELETMLQEQDEVRESEIEDGNHSSNPSTPPTEQFS